MGSPSKGILLVGAGGGGRDPDTKMREEGAETMGEVESDLEVEVSRQERGRGLTWRGREESRDQRGEDIGAESQPEPHPEKLFAQHRGTAWVSRSALPQSPRLFPGPSPSLSGSTSCGPSQSPGQVVSGLFWCAGFPGSLKKGRGGGLSPPLCGWMGRVTSGDSSERLGYRVLTAVGGGGKLQCSPFSTNCISRSLKLGRGVYLGRF